MRNKKGQIGGVVGTLGPIAIMIIILGVVIVIGMLILGQSQTTLNQKESEGKNVEIINETVTGWVPDTFALLSNECQAGLRCTAVENQSIGGASALLVNTSIYDCQPGVGIKVINGTGDDAVTGQLNVTYRCDRGGSGWNATKLTREVIGDEIPGWIGVIIIVIIGAILIGLVSIFRRE